MNGRGKGRPARRTARLAQFPRGVYVGRRVLLGGHGTTDSRNEGVSALYTHVDAMIETRGSSVTVGSLVGVRKNLRLIAPAH